MDETVKIGVLTAGVQNLHQGIPKKHANLIQRLMKGELRTQGNTLSNKKTLKVSHFSSGTTHSSL